MLPYAYNTRQACRVLYPFYPLVRDNGHYGLQKVQTLFASLQFLQTNVRAENVSNTFGSVIKIFDRRQQKS